MGCIPAPAAKAALEEATRLWPNRSVASDGICSSPDHRRQNSNSDHDRGEAFDLTHDPAAGVDCNLLAESLRRRGIAGLETRVTYLIWNRQICSAAKAGWAWRAYDGSNPHTKHLHVSLDPTRRYDVSPWFTAPPTPTEDDVAVLARESGKPTVYLTDLLTAKRSLDSAAEVAALKAAGIRDVGEVPASLLADVPTVAG